MKLTFSISGGFTGLSKEKTIDVESLDDKIRNSLLQYFKEHESPPVKANATETWSLDNKQEIQLDKTELPAELKSLYDQMKKNVSYVKK